MIKDASAPAIGSSTLAFVGSTESAKSASTRCISKDCAKNLTMKEMKTRLHAVLARYVSQGK